MNWPEKSALSCIGPGAASGIAGDIERSWGATGGFVCGKDATLDPDAYSKRFRVFFEARKNEKARQTVEAAPAGPPPDAAPTL